MTKAYLTLPKRRVSYLPKYSSRRFGGDKTHFRSMCFKEDGEGDEEEKEKLLKTIKGIVGKQLEGRAKKEDVENIVGQLSFLTKTKDESGKEIEAPFPIQELRSLVDPKSGAMAKLVEMGLEVQKLKAEGERSIKDMSVRGQIEAWLKSTPKETGGVRTVQQIVDNIKNGVKEDIPELQLRVASPMLVSTVNAGASNFIGRVEVEQGVNDFLRYPNKFWEFLTKGRTGAPTYVWINKTNPLGAAAFIGPGVAKPGISFELAAESSIAKKIAVKAKAGTELLQDIDGMETMIMQELREQLDIEINQKLMTGVNSSTVPAGIRTLSQAFSFYTDAAANIRTTNPTYMDAIRAAVAALRSGKLTGDITVFVNSIDAANMDLSKAVDSGVYLLPPFSTSNGQQISGARIIEDQFIPVGYFQAGFMRYYRILIYKDYTVSWGWENTDFTDNLVTVVGEMRLHQFFNSIHTGAFMYDTFDNVVNTIKEA